MSTILNRRHFLATAAGGAPLGGWLGRLAADAGQAPQPARAKAKAKACILLWMSGGPSHIDTWDPKPDAPAEFRGEFAAIDTAVPGIRIAEHLPRVAKLMGHAAILRGMSTSESDHALATHHLQTGYQSRGGAVVYPGLGAVVARELGRRDVALPNFVTIGRGPRELPGAGFLGPDARPLGVTDPVRGLDHLAPAVAADESARQIDLLRQLDEPFHRTHRSDAAEAHRAATARAVLLMNSTQKRAFDLSEEPDDVRAAYGRPGSDAGAMRGGGKLLTAGGGGFGQGCLMARRLVEAGIPFVQVMMGDGVSWDTHRDNFPRVRALSAECDVAMAALIADLRGRGLLESTLVVWMGEFGRTPRCAGGGRNHWAKAWSTVLFGGGIRGGQVVGRTDRVGAEVTDRPISVTDFLATVYTLMGIDPGKKNHPPGVDRPIPIVDTSKGIKLITELS